MSKISELQALEEPQTRILFDLQTPRHKIVVREYQNYRWLQIGGDAIQSVVDTTHKARVVVPVNQAMLMATLFARSVDRVLILGSGGGSFERFFAQEFPRSSITAIEKSQQVIQLAHEFFFYPDSVNIVNGRADHLLVDWPETFDLILCDIFDGEQHPSCLATGLFHQHLSDRLHPTGVVAFNLLTFDQQDLVEILQCARRHFTHTALYAVPDHNNVVLFASKQNDFQFTNDRHRERLVSGMKEFDLSLALDTIHSLPDVSAKD
ncbi:MAG: fused MFS/spermidine synthase [Pseudomonadota bacterium]